jgi:hypothetical protein
MLPGHGPLPFGYSAKITKLDKNHIYEYALGEHRVIKWGKIIARGEAAINLKEQFLK